jgi:hypothetical protein
MKTENDYAEALIDRYTEYAHTHWDENKGFDMEVLKINSINCAIIDVTNTIGALWDEHKIQYYQNVLQILKDKL